MSEASRYVQTGLVTPSGQPLMRMSQSLPAPYQAGGHSRRLRGWIAPGTGPNDSATGTSQTLRNRSREQYRNNGWARAGINKLVSNIIGTGIKPRSTAESKDFQRASQLLWAKSAREMDPEGLLDIYGQQSQAVNTWLQGGEAFIRLRPRRDSDGLAVPMQIQVMEPEMCPVNYNGLNRLNPIRAGIEYNRIGQRLAYWFYRAHPGDRAVAVRVDSTRLVRVPASQVIHLFDPVRPGQSRGVIQMAPVLTKLYDTDKYDDATLLRQQNANLYAAFVINTGNEAPPVPNSFGDDVDSGQKEGDVSPLGMEPGLIQELLEGQDIKFGNPPSAGDTYGDFMRWQLLNACAGGEVPYEVLTGDFSQINDRTARVLLQDFRRRIQQRQHHIVIHQFCRRVWSDWWLPRAVLAGALSAPGYARNPGVYAGAKHIPQAWPYIHPEQDINTAIKAERAGYKTKDQIITETGGEDYDDVMDRHEAEKADADARNLVFDTDPRHTDSSGKRVGETQDREETQA